MKKLYLIGGTMGVGKTTTCRILRDMLPKSVFLDGDWCWNMHPFTVNDETKAMVMENIAFMLNNFITCSEIENIVFCWVMDDMGIIDEIKARLRLGGCRLIPISLVCSPEALEERLRADVEKGLRQPDIIARSIERIPRFELLQTEKLDVSAISPVKAAEIIAGKY